jgi:hypothetical protein
MFERLRNHLLRLLRVPPEPDPPFGHPASLRVFRASRKLYLLRLVRWGLGQLVAVAGIIFWLGVVAVSEREASRVRLQSPEATALRNLPAGQNRVHLGPLRQVPPALFDWLRLGEVVGLTIYFLQLVITYAALRLDYELRWYIVTDRSLRIRSGVWKIQETTMSFANLQQVVLTQGPLERLLGIANVQVESAGGGSKNSQHDQGKSESMHTGSFKGVENAEQIRDLILERLRSFRDSGLGDPDEPATGPLAPAPAGPKGDDLLDAGRELLSEARQLRAALKPRTDV